jgi:hypothetical protein
MAAAAAAETEEAARTQVLRELAARSSRAVVTLALPRGCALRSWSALAAPLPPYVHVLGVSATRPPGAPSRHSSGGGGGGCALWLRLQNLSPAPRPDYAGFEAAGGGSDEMIDAAAVARALHPGEVSLHPTRIAGRVVALFTTLIFCVKTHSIDDCRYVPCNRSDTPRE